MSTTPAPGSAPDRPGDQRPRTRVLPEAGRRFLGRRLRLPRFHLGRFAGMSTLVLLGAGILLPPQFVTESAGPTFNTIGAYEGQQLITVTGHPSYPTTGALDMTTVYVSGGPNGPTHALAVLGAWLDPQRTAMPADLLYPPQTTMKQVSQQNAAAMTDSQTTSQVAAARYLDLPVAETLTVAGLAQDTAAPGLEPGDVLVSINGEPIETFEQLGEMLEQHGGEEILLGYRSEDGQQHQLHVTPRQDPQTGRWILGIYLDPSYDLPFDVDFGLKQVGGPSAGMMFALGIIDEMTEQNLTGGRHFAGTGTIDVSGNVGAIGGIQQKMVGARQDGAEVFLAPAANCDEVIDHIPNGLSVVRVATLEEAADAVEQIGSGKKTPDQLPQCR